MAVRDDNRARIRIAFVTLIMSMVGIVVIALVALALAKDKDESSRLVFASVLPLLGTWVGAVLAFYFSRENLHAASETTLDAVRAVGGFGPDTMIAAVMTRFDGILPRKEVADEAAAKLLPLTELYDLMKTFGRGRVPIFDSKHAALYVLHEPDIDKYAQTTGTTAPALTDTVEQLLADPTIATEIISFVTVPLTATLAEARAEMSKNVHTKDIFVTDTGQRSGKVVGWLTNSALARSK